MVSNGGKRGRHEEYDEKNNVQIDKKRKFIEINGQQSVKIDDEDDDNDNGPLQLDDINNDCLRHIFEFLTLHELIDVVETSNRFRFPAAEAFSRRYRTRKIEAVATSDPVLQFNRSGYVHITGAAAMNGLKHFGSRMSTVSANFDAFDLIDFEHRHAIDVAILQNCADSLVNFEVHFCIESHFQTISQPFAKAESVILNGCILGDKFAQLNLWFPNVVALKLAGIWLSQPVVLQATFAHLTDLSIINDVGAVITSQTIQQMLRLNRQLESLQLRCNYGVEMLQTIAQNLQQLQKLDLSTPDDRFASFPANQTFTFPSVRTFTLHALSKSDFVLKMPFALGNVAELRLYGFNQFHSLVIALIMSGDQLNTITLLPFQESWARTTDDDDALKWALQTRRHLNKLELCTDEFEGDDLARLIRVCKNLKQLRLMSLQLNSLQATGLEDDWTVYKHGSIAHYINMDDLDFGFKFQLFHHVCMKRNQ